jgi:excisionase family DNA binding protein
MDMEAMKPKCKETSTVADSLLTNYERCFDRIGDAVAAAILAAAEVQLEVMSLPEFLTVKQAAGQAQVSEQMIYYLCESRLLTHMRVGEGRGTIRIPRNALREFCETQIRDRVAEASPHYKPRGKRGRAANQPWANAG